MIRNTLKVPQKPSLTGSIILVFCLSGIMAHALPKTELEPETLKAFEEYAIGFEKNIDAAVSGRKPFLWIQDRDPEERNRAIRGETLIFKPDENVDVHGGIIHAWGVSVFIAGASAENVVNLLLDYDRHKNVYPSVIDSRLLEKKDDTVRGYLQFKYKKVITAVLNTEHKAELTRLDKGRYFIRVRSTRIAEVENYGEKDQHELPVGKDSGFMWRLYTYWFIEPRADGVFLECRSLTLSRSIPFGLGWAVKPFINGVPRDSLEEMAEGTRRALAGRKTSPASESDK